MSDTNDRWPWWMVALAIVAVIGVFRMVGNSHAGGDPCGGMTGQARTECMQFQDEIWSDHMDRAGR